MIENAPHATKARLGRVVFARWAYTILAGFFSGCLLYQVYLAGLGVFAGPGHWVEHTNFVRVFESIPILMLAAGIVGRLGIRMSLWTALTLVQILIQYALAHLGGAVGALHPVNGVLLIFLAVMLTYHSAKRAID